MLNNSGNIVNCALQVLEFNTPYIIINKGKLTELFSLKQENYGGLLLTRTLSPTTLASETHLTPQDIGETIRYFTETENFNICSNEIRKYILDVTGKEITKKEESEQFRKFLSQEKKYYPLILYFLTSKNGIITDIKMLNISSINKPGGMDMDTISFDILTPEKLKEQIYTSISRQNTIENIEEHKINPLLNPSILKPKRKKLTLAK